MRFFIVILRLPLNIFYKKFLKYCEIFLNSTRKNLLWFLKFLKSQISSIISLFLINFSLKSRVKKNAKIIKRQNSELSKQRKEKNAKHVNDSNDCNFAHIWSLQWDEKGKNNTQRRESVNGSYNKGIIISLLIASHSIISHSYFSLVLLLGF